MKKVLSIIMCVFLLVTLSVNVFAEKNSADIKDKIKQQKENTTLKMTDTIFVKAVNPNSCEEILKSALNGYEYVVEKYYEMTGTHKVKFNSPEDADKAVDILNEYDEIIYAQNDYYVNPNLEIPTQQLKPAPSISKKYEIGILNKSSIIVGDPDGNLRENDEITRAEFAAVLCRTMGCETEAQTENITQKKYFSDVPSEHWAAGYINFAYENKAISGFPDGNFYPEQPVTNEQVIKMLIAAWGYGDEAEANGGYPNGYMKVAKEHGILDTIEFNYANASKRWIASIFVYGILSMTPENETVKQPVKTQLFTVDTPREENDTYVERPEEILKNVSKESSVYERTVFEQTIPNKYLPIEITEKSIKNVWYRDFSIGINIVDASGEGFNKELCVGESVDLSGFANGEYNIIVGYNDGNVDDYSFGKIIISDNNVELSGLMHRYTSVRDVIQFEKEIIEVELSNEKPSNDMPFEIKAASDGKGNYILCINYSGSLKDDEVFLYSINDMDLKFDVYEKFDAPMYKIEPIVIQGLMEDKEYILQIRLDSEYFEKSIKGTLKVDNDDFILKGDYQIVNMKY